MSLNSSEYKSNILKLKVLIDSRQVMVKNGFVGNRDLLPEFCVLFADIIGSRLRFDGLIPIFSDTVPLTPKDLRHLYIATIEKFNLGRKSNLDSDHLKTILMELWGLIEMLFITTKLESKTPDVLPSDYDKFTESSINKLRCSLDSLKPLFFEAEMEKISSFYKKAYDHLQNLVSDKVWIGIPDECSAKLSPKKLKLSYKSTTLKTSDFLQQQQLISLIEDFPYLLCKLQILVKNKFVKSKLISFQAFVRFVMVFFTELQKKGFSPTMPYSTVNLSMSKLKTLENTTLFETGSLLMKSTLFCDSSFSRWIMHHLRLKTVLRLWGIYTLMVAEWKTMCDWPAGKMSNYKPTMSEDSKGIYKCFEKIFFILQKYSHVIPKSHDNLTATILDSFKGLKNSVREWANGLQDDCSLKRFASSWLPSFDTEDTTDKSSVVCSSVCIPGQDGGTSMFKPYENEKRQPAPERIFKYKESALLLSSASSSNSDSVIEISKRLNKNQKVGGSNSVEDFSLRSQLNQLKKNLCGIMQSTMVGKMKETSRAGMRPRCVKSSTSMPDPFNKNCLVDAIRSIRNNIMS